MNVFVLWPFYTLKVCNALGFFFLPPLSLSPDWVVLSRSSSHFLNVFFAGGGASCPQFKLWEIARHPSTKMSNNNKWALDLEKTTHTFSVDVCTADGSEGRSLFFFFFFKPWLSFCLSSLVGSYNVCRVSSLGLIRLVWWQSINSL